jgi:6-pyruvoyltetrahydropterin/6-carboxytetrahydropterin synthase
MFEVGVARTFHALHQLEAEEASASHEHSHDYRCEVVVRGAELDENAMLLDLDALGAAVADCLAELDAADLDELPAFAGRSTTVETVADHIWDHVRDLLAPGSSGSSASSLVGLRVTVYESGDAWASVDRPLRRDA